MQERVELSKKGTIGIEKLGYMSREGKKYYFRNGQGSNRFRIKTLTSSPVFRIRIRIRIRMDPH